MSPTQDEKDEVADEALQDWLDRGATITVYLKNRSALTGTLLRWGSKSIKLAPTGTVVKRDDITTMREEHAHKRKRAKPPIP